MERESVAVAVARYREIARSWSTELSEDRSTTTARVDAQLIHDLIVDEVERLRLIIAAGEDAVKQIRREVLAIRQGEGYTEEVEASWREHAVDNSPLSDALWEFIRDALVVAGLPDHGWERLKWLNQETPDWLRELARAARVCGSPYCFMRCDPNEVRDILIRHGIWSHGQQVHSVDDEIGLILES